MADEGECRRTIHAVVDPVGARLIRGRRFWMRKIEFYLIAWRVDGEPVRTTWAVATAEVPLWTALLWRRRIPVRAPIAFESVGIEMEPSGFARLRMTRLLAPSADRELAEAAAPLLVRDVREVAGFGTLAREPAGDEYEGRCTWHGMSVDLSLAGHDPTSLEPTLAHARALDAAWDEWEGRLRALVTSTLLPLWIDWNPDEPPIDGAELFRRIAIQSIHVTEEGGVHLVMDAGEQFADHVIVVEGTVKGGPVYIDIEG